MYVCVYIYFFLQSIFIYSVYIYMWIYIYMYIYLYIFIYIIVIYESLNIFLYMHVQIKDQVSCFLLHYTRICSYICMYGIFTTAIYHFLMFLNIFSFYLRLINLLFYYSINLYILLVCIYVCMCVSYIYAFFHI